MVKFNKDKLPHGWTKKRHKRTHPQGYYWTYITSEGKRLRSVKQCEQEYVLINKNKGKKHKNKEKHKINGPNKNKINRPNKTTSRLASIAKIESEEESPTGTHVVLDIYFKSKGNKSFVVRAFNTKTNFTFYELLNGARETYGICSQTETEESSISNYIKNGVNCAIQMESKEKIHVKDLNSKLDLYINEKIDGRVRPKVEFSQDT